jgi:hypothetical protein
MDKPYDWRAARARNKWRNTATMDAFFAALPKPKDERFANLLDALGTSDPTEPPKEKSE